MKRVLLAGVGLGVLTSVAAAEPKRMADAEMYRVAAGFVGSGDVTVSVGDVTVSPTIGAPTISAVGVNTNVAVSTAVANVAGVLGDQATAAARNYDQLVNGLDLGISSSLGQQ